MASATGSRVCSVFLRRVACLSDEPPTYSMTM